MKIALIFERFNLQRGGAERSTYELAHALTELGEDITLVAAKIENQHTDNLPFKMRQVPVTGLTRTRQWYNFQKAMADLAAGNEFDIIHSMVPLDCAHVYQPRGGSIWYSTKRHAASYKYPLQRRFKLATAWLNRPRHARIASERMLCLENNTPTIAALSNYVADQFRSIYQLNDDRIHLIRNGIDVERLRSMQAHTDGKKLRHLYDRQGNKALFLFAAENLRLKGLDWLLKAAEKAAEQLSDGLRDFVIMVLSSENYQNFWIRTQKPTLKHRILFMGATNRIDAQLHMCDAVVLPTYNDACSRLVLEALAVGKPAITTSKNGAADFLDNGKYGFVIEQSDNIDALAQALLQLCDPNIQKNISQAIEFDRLHERVSIKRHAQELITLYNELL